MGTKYARLRASKIAAGRCPGCATKGGAGCGVVRAGAGLLDSRGCNGGLLRKLAGLENHLGVPDVSAVQYLVAGCTQTGG